MDRRTFIKGVGMAGAAAALGILPEPTSQGAVSAIAKQRTYHATVPPDADLLLSYIENLVSTGMRKAENNLVLGE